MEIHRTNLQSFLRAQGGRIVSLSFTKLDGEVRDLVGRLGVIHYITESGVTREVRDTPKAEAVNRPYLTVYDMQKRGFRNVNLSTVSRVRADNMELAVIG